MPRKIIDFNSYRVMPPAQNAGITGDSFRDGYLKYTIYHIDAFSPDEPSLFYWYITDLENTVYVSGYAITKTECVDAIRLHANEIKAYYTANPDERPQVEANHA